MVPIGEFGCGGPGGGGHVLVTMAGVSGGGERVVGWLPDSGRATPLLTGIVLL